MSNVLELAWKNNGKTWNKILSLKVSVSRSSKTEHTWLRIDTRVRFIFLKSSQDIKYVDTRKCLITFANRCHYALLANHRSSYVLAFTWIEVRHLVRYAFDIVTSSTNLIIFYRCWPHPGRKNKGESFHSSHTDCSCLLT